MEKITFLPCNKIVSHKHELTIIVGAYDKDQCDSIYSIAICPHQM